MSKQALTPTPKAIEAKCSKCISFWQRNDYETCTNDQNRAVYGKKMKPGSLVVCDLYDEC